VPKNQVFFIHRILDFHLKVKLLFFKWFKKIDFWFFCFFHIVLHDVIFNVIAHVKH
jgi:hypothetical protein